MTAAVKALRARRFDPERRGRIIEAALDIVSEYGVAGATHRLIAQKADVPLGSMTYHFASLDALLIEAFSRFAQSMSDITAQMLEAAETPEAAAAIVVDIIVEHPWAEPENQVLAYELYAFASRKPEVRTVTEDWLDRSREALGRHFDPVAVRGLDALIEGLGIHNTFDRDPISRTEVERIVKRLTEIGLADQEDHPDYGE